MVVQRVEPGPTSNCGLLEAKDGGEISKSSHALDVGGRAHC
jgi:hypothetical protein